MTGIVDTGSTGPVIEVIGLGMGQSLSRPDMERLVAADVLAGGARLLERFSHLPGGRIVIGTPLSKSLDEIASARSGGKAVIVLADGDPLFYGIGARLIERFGTEALRFSPGVTAVQTACARLAMPWHDLPAVSLHGRDDPAPLISALAATGKAAVYTDGVNTPDAVARLLLEHGMDEAALFVLENLGSPEERVRRLSPAQAVREDFAPLNIVVVDLGGLARTRPMLGRPDEFYAMHEGLITKWPVRAASLAALGLSGKLVLWDVGAGCGAVGIEASALMPSGRVYAVERDPERHGHVKENIRRSGAWLVKAVKGEAPEVFRALPDPDRVFLGGSLGSGNKALAAICDRLKPGGRLVANAVLLGSAHRAMGYLKALGWAPRLDQVQASLGSPLAGDVRLAAINPVFIITADKPA